MSVRPYVKPPVRSLADRRRQDDRDALDALCAQRTLGPHITPGHIFVPAAPAPPLRVLTDVPRSVGRRGRAAAAEKSNAVRQPARCETAQASPPPRLALSPGTPSSQHRERAPRIESSFCLSESQLAEVKREYDATFPAIEEEPLSRSLRPYKEPTVTERLNELHAAMVKFHGVAEVALLNMNARYDKEEDTKQWVRPATADLHAAEISKTLADVAQRNLAALQLIEQLKAVEMEVKQEAATPPRIPPVLSIGGKPPSGHKAHGVSRSKADAAAASIDEGREAVDADLTDLMAAEPYASADTIGLHTSLLQIGQMASTSNERVILKGNVFVAAKQFGRIRDVLSQAQLQLHVLNSTVMQARRSVANAEARLIELERRDLKTALSVESDHVVVVAEMANFSHIARCLTRTELTDMEKMFQSIAVRTAMAAGGRVTLAHSEAVAAVFVSVVDGLAWARALQCYSTAFPWADAVTALSTCSPEQRGLLHQRELEAVRAAAQSRAASSKTLQRFEQVNAAFQAAIESETHRRTREQIDQSTTDAIVQLTIKHVNRGPRIRVGAHQISSLHDLQALEAMPVNPGLYVAATLAALARPGQILVSESVVSGATAALPGGALLQTVGARLTELDSLLPFASTLEACRVTQAHAIYFESLGEKTTAARRMPPSAFDALAWLTRSFATVHNDALYASGHAGGATSYHHAATQKDPEPTAPEQSPTQARTKRKGTLAVHSLPQPTKTGSSGDSFDSPTMTHGEVTLSFANFGDAAAIMSGSESPGRKKKGGLGVSRRDMGMSMSRAAPPPPPPMTTPSLSEDELADASCQTGSWGSQFGIADQGECLTRHCISLLGAVLGKAEAKFSHSEVCDRVAAVLATDIVAADLMPMREGIAQAFFTSPLYSSTWDTVWERLDRKLNTILPAAAAFPDSVCGQEIEVCRDVICCTVGLLDETLDYLRTAAGKRRFGDGANMELGQILRGRATTIRNFVAVARPRDRVSIPSPRNALVSQDSLMSFNHPRDQDWNA